jgi:hypothetical protein
MSSVTRPRGPLPARVYWTRRLLVLGLVLGLVFGIAHLLGGRSDNPQARPVAAAAGSTTTPAVGAQAPAAQAPAAQAPAAQSPAGVRQGAAPPARKRRAAEAAASASPTPTPTPLAVPSGPCSPTDVRVEPRVSGTAYAGSPVTFRLRLTTLESPACTWVVSPASLVLRLTSGSDRIWSTQDCKAAIRRQQVVVRKDHATSVEVTWRGQRSDGTCSRTTPWAEPGFYHATAAALGAEPTDYQFELHRPRAVTITPSPKPDPSHRHGRGRPDKPAHKKDKKVD